MAELPDGWRWRAGRGPDRRPTYLQAERYDGAYTGCRYDVADILDDIGRALSVAERRARCHLTADAPEPARRATPAQGAPKAATRPTTPRARQKAAQAGQLGMEL